MTLNARSADLRPITAADHVKSIAAWWPQYDRRAYRSTPKNRISVTPREITYELRQGIRRLHDTGGKSISWLAEYFELTEAKIQLILEITP